MAATGLGENLTEPLDFMQGIKLPLLPEGMPDSPLRAFARFQQGLMTSPLYAGHSCVDFLLRFQRHPTLSPTLTPLADDSPSVRVSCVAEDKSGDNQLF